jgi:hypothetical protein
LFPLPFLDLVLDIVVGHKKYSFMGGYSGYNQVKVAKEDQEKMLVSLNGEHRY